MTLTPTWPAGFGTGRRCCSPTRSGRSSRSSPGCRGDAAAALAAFDRRVRSGTLPWVVDVSDCSYGFDFAGNDCEILDSDDATPVTDDDVWSIASDGGGNLYVLLTNGRVAVWFHEEQVIEAGTQFDNLDVFLYSIVRYEHSIVRYEAARAGVLDRTAVKEDFRALTPEVGPAYRRQDSSIGGSIRRSRIGLRGANHEPAGCGCQRRAVRSTPIG